MFRFQYFLRYENLFMYLHTAINSIDVTFLLVHSDIVIKHFTGKKWTNLVIYYKNVDPIYPVK